jgi:hypothetical protein
MNNLFAAIILFLAVLLCLIKYNAHEVAKGKAISHFVKKVYDMEISPEDARYFDVVLTGVDVKMDNIDIFPWILKK